MGLQLTMGKSTAISAPARQTVLDCFARSCSLSGWGMLAILLSAGLAMSVGYIAHEGMKEWCGSSDDDVVAQPRVEKLSPPAINRKTPNAPYRRMLEVPTVERHVASQIESEERISLRVSAEEVGPGTSPAELASEKNQVMDDLLNQQQIPSDYGDVMVELYRDKSHDILTRDFAVQHIGLYAQALNRRGQYDPKSAEAESCRSALFDAADETGTIVAAAAFRALSDVSEFDSSINARHLNNALVRCAADESASSAARIMAVQLCGERQVKESKESLRSIVSSSSTSKPLRLAAKHSIERL